MLMEHPCAAAHSEIIKMKELRFILSLLLFILCPSIIEAQVFKTQSGYAEFKAEASLNNYKGVSNQLAGEVNIKTRSVYFKIPIKSLDTGIGKRNRDMYNLMQVNKYPYAEFKGNIVSDFNPASQASRKVTVSGNFTLRGIQKPLKVAGVMDRDGSKLNIEASWNIYITQYNIEPPRFLINKVKDRHLIYIKASLQQQ